MRRSPAIHIWCRNILLFLTKKKGKNNCYTFSTQKKNKGSDPPGWITAFAIVKNTE